MHRFGNQLDHLGIVVVMWGSTIPSDYFGFYDEPVLMSSYLTLVSFWFGQLPQTNDYSLLLQLLVVEYLQCSQGSELEPIEPGGC